MNNSEVFSKILGEVVKYFKWIILLIIILIACSGIKIIKNDEVAVILRFGKLVGNTQQEQVHSPGLLFCFPYIIDDVKTVPVGKVQELSVKTHYNMNDDYSNIENTGYIITGDKNIVMVDTSVKYKISDPVKYALYNKNINKTLDGILSGCMTSCGLDINVDGLLTDQKNKYAKDVMSSSQDIINELDLGVELTSVEFKDITPPSNVKQYFNEVNTAAVQKETKIKEANQYKKRSIPEANTRAEKMVSNAKIVKQQKLTRANNDAAEFNGLYKEYQSNKEIIKEKLYREKISKILNKMGTKIVIPDDGKTPKVFLP